jgi:hypothetical protein
MRVRLTDELLDLARVAKHRAQGYLFDTELPTFGVVVGKRSQMFIVQFRDAAGIKRRYGLGHRSPTFNVEAARAKAREEIAARKGGSRSRLRQAEQRIEHAIRDYFRELLRAQLRDHEVRERER